MRSGRATVARIRSVSAPGRFGAHRDYAFVDRSRPVDPGASDGGSASPRASRRRYGFRSTTWCGCRHSRGYSSIAAAGLLRNAAGAVRRGARIIHSHRWAPHGARGDVVNQPKTICMSDRWRAGRRAHKDGRFLARSPQQISVVGLSWQDDGDACHVPPTPSRPAHLHGRVWRGR